jgi:hypothetical protein
MGLLRKETSSNIPNTRPYSLADTPFLSAWNRDNLRHAEGSVGRESMAEMGREVRAWELIVLRSRFFFHAGAMLLTSYRELL